MNYALRYPKFWWGYFLFTCLMVVSNTIYEAVAEFGEVDVLSLCFTVVAFAGLWPLFGYARQKRIPPRRLWMAVLVLDGLALLVLVLALLGGAVQSVSPVFLLLAVTAAALGVPNLFAVYQYCFKSPHLWT
jgi:hypothetical protein